MMFRRAVEEDESGSDWDDLSSKDSVRASLTPNGANASIPKGIPTSPHDQKVKSKVAIREKLFPRADRGGITSKESSTSSRGIEGQPQIAVELSHAPTLDLTPRSHSNSISHPVAVQSSPRVSNHSNHEQTETVGKESSLARPFFISNAPASVHIPQESSSGRSPVQNSDTIRNGSANHTHNLFQQANINSTLPPNNRSHDHPVLPLTDISHDPPVLPSTNRSHDHPVLPPTDRSHDHRVLPSTDRSHDHSAIPPTDRSPIHPTLPPTNRSRDPHSVYEVRHKAGGGRVQAEGVAHVAKLEETGDDEESNAFGIPEEMNMAITEDSGHKKSVRLDLEFNSVSVEKTDSMAAAHHPPRAYMARVADRWEKLSARGVEEACSLLRLVTDLVIAILLGSAYCLLHHVLRKLLCGLGHLFADSIYKPALSLCFNGFMWPCLQLCSQLSKALVLVIKPLLEVLGVLFSWTAHVCRAIRPVSLIYKTKSSPTHSTNGGIVKH